MWQDSHHLIFSVFSTSSKADGAGEVAEGAGEIEPTGQR